MPLNGQRHWANQQEVVSKLVLGGCFIAMAGRKVVRHASDDSDVQILTPKAPSFRPPVSQLQHEFVKLCETIKVNFKNS